MKAPILLSAAAGMLLAVTAFAPKAQALPAMPNAVQQAPSNVDLVQMRRGGARMYRPRGGPRFANRGWRGGPRWSNRGWNGRHWAGRPGWGRPGWGRPGWGPGWGYRPGWGYYGPGWGSGWGWGVATGALLAAPYVYNDDCGYVTVRRWINGRRVWVRQYTCW